MALVDMSIDFDTREVDSMFSSFERQVPFATSVALNDTAKDVKKAVQVGMEKQLDRPTPFTKRGIFIKRSSKRDLVAIVSLMDLQVGYLLPNIVGGAGHIDKRFMRSPKNIKLNKFGNIPRTRIAVLLKRKDVFRQVIKGIDGIWQRNRQGLKLLVRLDTKAPTYKRIFNYWDVAHTEAIRKFPSNFDRALSKAIATAR